MGLTGVAAELGEDGGGAVDDLGLLVDGAVDAALEIAKIGDELGDLGEQRQVDAQAGDRVAHPAAELERGLDVEQLGWLENVAAGGLVDGPGDVAGGAEREVGLELEGAPALGGEPLPAQHLPVVRGGLQVEGEAAGGGEGAERGQPVDDLVVFEGDEGLRVHGSSVAEVEGHTCGTRPAYATSRPITSDASRWRSGMLQ